MARRAVDSLGGLVPFFLGRVFAFVSRQGEQAGWGVQMSCRSQPVWSLWCRPGVGSRLSSAELVARHGDAKSTLKM